MLYIKVKYKDHEYLTGEIFSCKTVDVNTVEGVMFLTSNSGALAISLNDIESVESV